MTKSAKFTQIEGNASKCATSLLANAFLNIARSIFLAPLYVKTKEPQTGLSPSAPNKERRERAWKVLITC